ncbi:MAG: EF-P beta-lysylation protein EpmB [Pirellulales bacterium]|nr:EF-P beta-lysylation protein EpmB [Pirellulales bacterium]
MASTDDQIDRDVVPPGRDWRADWAGAIRDGAELCERVRLPRSLAAEPGGLSVRVPRHYLSRITPGDAHDPLLLQVLPRKEEGETPLGFSSDPLSEAAAGSPPSLLWKYSGRSLIVATGRCGVHCRFCFRRHFPSTALPPDLAAFEAVLRRIAREKSIHEVILSGGDPLTLGDDQLADWVKRLAGLAHLRRLRIHTRMPIVIPSRVTPGLVDLLHATRLVPIVVVHVNHPAEIDREVELALARLVDAGVPVLNQSVLLRDVNDDVDVLAELYERLVDLRVMPYYLHQLDRVAGAAHFEVAEEEGCRLVESLRARLPGYAVPRYVREVPGASSKVWLTHRHEDTEPR